MTELLAQTDPSAFPEWLQLGGVGAAVSVVVWYLYYTTAVILPKLQERHSATIEKIVDRHAGTVKDISDTLKVEMAEERKHHRETCAQIVDGIDRHISRLDCQREKR